jgi:8-oxo-dGTP diphosphatase
MSDAQRPMAAVGVYICHEGKVLAFRRVKPHARDTWACMGGYIENGEHWFDAALREAKEEAGIDVHSPSLIAVTNDVYPDGKHSITFQVAVKTDSPHFVNAEPEKHQDMGWFKWDEIPKPHMVSLQVMYDNNHKPMYL